MKELIENSQRCRMKVVLGAGKTKYDGWRRRTNMTRIIQSATEEYKEKFQQQVNQL